MSMNRIVAALCTAGLGLTLSMGTTGCVTAQKSASTKPKAAKVASTKAKHKSRFTKGNDTDFSLGDVDEKLLKRGQDSRTASAFDSI